MRARELADSASVVDATDRVSDALRVLLSSGLPGLVVRKDSRYTVVPASQVLRVALPRYVRDDPSLGRVWDEASADHVAEVIQTSTVDDLLVCLDRPARFPETFVDGDATVVELAAVMSAARVPLVAVVEDGEFLGVVTVNALVSRLLG